MANLYRVKVFRRSSCWLVIFPFVFSFLATGCEPLRKKFTRKKKEEKKETEFVPVLEPQEYPTPVFNPQTEYSRRYNLWKVWYDDFMAGLDENGTNKRQAYIVGQLMAQLEEMEKLLKGQPQGQIHQYKDTLNEVNKLLSLPVPLRNISLIKTKISVINSKIQNNLRPQQIKDSLQ